jgi:nucleoside-diphosphate-sugar epimerase
MRIAIVGYTGFVGSNLRRNIQTEWLFNSANISSIRGQHFDVLINAGVSSLKWKANKEPEVDREHIAALWDDLSTVKVDKFVQMSTLDVLPAGGPRYEDETPVQSLLEPYGKHRLELEHWVEETFDNHMIVRFPHLVGRGLKKNFFFDLIHNRTLDMVDHRDIFQFYHLDHLWRDLKHFSDLSAKLVHISTEPITAGKLAKVCFDLNFENVCDRDPRVYDLRTRWDYRSSKVSGYMYNKAEVISDLVALRDLLREQDPPS